MLCALANTEYNSNIAYHSMENRMQADLFLGEVPHQMAAAVVAAAEEDVEHEALDVEARTFPN